MTTSAQADLSGVGAEGSDGDTRARLPLGLRLLPLLVVLLLGPLVALRPLNDPDTWWHLRSGEDLSRDLVLTGPDPWSPFTTNTWVRHQWLAELGMYRLWDAAGPAGLAGAVAVLAGVIVATTYLVLRRDAPVLVASLVAVVAVVGTTVSLVARPQVLSFPLTAVAAAAWWWSSRDGRARWWLVPLTWVWACLHGFWLLVPVLGVVVVVGMALERRPPRDIIRLGLLTLSTVAAAAVTPVGPRLLLSGLDVSQITGFIEEWLPAPRGTVAFYFVAAMLVVTIGLWSWGAPPSWPEVLLAGFAAYLAVAHGRTIAVASLVAAPLLAGAITRRLPPRHEPLRWREVSAVVVALALGSGAAWALAPTRAPAAVGFPTALSPQVDALPAGTVVCNDYFVGGWLLWSDRNATPVIDGRTELYPVSALEDYVTMSTGAPGWDRVVADRGCTAALVDERGGLARRLQETGWTTQGTDGRWLLLTRPR